jgi:hypothetical protein
MRQHLRRLAPAVFLVAIMIGCAAPQVPEVPEVPEAPEAPEAPQAPAEAGRWDSAVWNTSAWGP